VKPTHHRFTFGSVSTLSTRQQIGAALVVGVAIGAIAYEHYAIQPPGGMSDFDQVWVAAHALRSSRDPYASLAATHWPFPLYYPLTAATLTLPLAFLSVSLARVLFFALGSASLAYALAKRPHRLLALLSGAFFQALILAQWTPLLTGAAVVAPLLSGAIWSAKPPIGLAVAIGTLRTRRAWILAAAGALIVVAASLLLDPRWPLNFFDAARHAPHIMAPVTILPLGPIVLLALVRWRDPDARLLVALACMPQTIAVHETLPLFLIPRTRRQTMILVLLSDGAFAVTMWLLPSLQDGREVSLAASAPLVGTCLLALCYLPCMVMLLRRPPVARSSDEAIP